MCTYLIICCNAESQQSDGCGENFGNVHLVFGLDVLSELIR